MEKLERWIKKYGDVIRITLGEREVVRDILHESSRPVIVDIILAHQVVINSHAAMAQTVVAQGPAFQSRPTFKLYHNDFASSGIWTVGSKLFDQYVSFLSNTILSASPYSDRLARTRKALSTQVTSRVLPR